jgi:hypothetical protein
MSRARLGEILQYPGELALLPAYPKARLQFLVKLVVSEMKLFVSLPNILDKEIRHLWQVPLTDDGVIDSPCQLLKLDGFRTVIQA